MREIKCVIIDDEKLARDIVKKYLAKHKNISIINECKNGFEGLKSIQEQTPDLIFLDIQMPKINGFEMLELLENPPSIIFTTAFDNYAIKAFEVNAIDYLLKPFSPERFNDAVNKAVNNILTASSSAKTIGKLKNHLDDRVEFLDRIIIKDRNKILIIPADDVVYLEAQDDYVLVHTEDSKHLKQKTMKHFETHLDPKSFIRIHRSYIVNINRIKNIELVEKETYYVVLHDGIKLPISKSGYSVVKSILK